MSIRILPILALLALSACGGSPYHQAKNDMMESKSSYKDCLDDHDGNENKCGAEKSNYETDRDALKALK